MVFQKVKSAKERSQRLLALFLFDNCFDFDSSDNCAIAQAALATSATITVCLEGDSIFSIASNASTIWKT